MDVGFAAVKAPTEATTILCRRGFLSVPHMWHGDQPLDTLITNAFESNWQHRWVEWSRLKWIVTTFFIRVGFFLASGTSCGWNQWCGQVKYVRRGYNYITKSTDVQPYLNRWAKSKLPWYYPTWLWAWLDTESDGSALDPDTFVDLRRGAWRVKPGTKVVEFLQEPPEATTAPAAVPVGVGTMVDARPADSTVAKGVPLEPVAADARPGRAHHQAEYDLIVLCTGYRQRFPFLKRCGGAGSDDAPLESASGSGSAKLGAATSVLCGGYGGAKSTLPLMSGAAPLTSDRFAVDLGDHQWSKRDHPLPDQHFITARGAPSLAFIGFVRPNVGAIPPIAEMQAMWWCARLKRAAKGGDPTGRFAEFRPCSRGAWGRKVYRLLAAKHQYSVDHGFYVHELARDLTSTPRLSALLWRPKALWAYAMGQSFTTFFRLTGPFAQPEAFDVAETELFHTTLTRGALANTNFLMMNAVLLLLNGSCWCVDHLVWRPFFSKPGRAFATLAVAGAAVAHRRRAFQFQA